MPKKKKMKGLALSALMTYFKDMEIKMVYYWVLVRSGSAECNAEPRIDPHK